MFTLFTIILAFMLMAAFIIILGCFISLMPAWFAVVALFTLDGIILGVIIRKIKRKKQQ